MKKTILAILIIVAVGAFTAEAKSLFKRKHYPPHFEYRIKAGFNIGGTTPLPLPREIRAVESYSPSLALSIGADVVRHINHKWAIMSGLTFETKGMRTWAKVKNYHIDMVISDGDAKGEINGMFTGRVKTKVKNDYLTLPLAAVYKVSPDGSSIVAFFSHTFSTLILPGLPVMDISEKDLLLATT